MKGNYKRKRATDTDCRWLQPFIDLDEDSSLHATYSYPPFRGYLEYRRLCSKALGGSGILWAASCVVVYIMQNFRF